MPQAGLNPECPSWAGKANSTLRNWPVFIRRHWKQNYYVTLILRISTPRIFTVFWRDWSFCTNSLMLPEDLLPCLKHHRLRGGTLSHRLAIASFPKTAVSQISCQIFFGFPLLSPISHVTPWCVTVPSRSSPCMPFSPTPLQHCLKYRNMLPKSFWISSNSEKNPFSDHSRWEKRSKKEEEGFG